MEEKLIETVLLENNLTLNFYDASRKIAGGRYYVALITRMDIPVKPEMFTNNGAEAATYDEIVGATGDMIVFEKKRERNFISAADKDAVFKEMCDSVLTHTSLYYSREDFPKKFILSEYKKIADHYVTSQ
ncbi:hypothetical protein BuS5_00127 [Desulfosarcina sp. BuS5]|uniref:hypothetical protein n=1 Tax=Desulfosarcina sp. BuS5 TaxID=933262 RepID=UPI00048419DF|nr:hypothetical protein [Desulfosarcina sp. BuS5]WDN87159.1 hypothetical protein BuS5_00127 [Desulfosarcina sp. BuS5]